MTEQPPEPSELDAPEPEQHTQVITGDEEHVAVYPDQTPDLLDDDEEL